LVCVGGRCRVVEWGARLTRCGRPPRRRGGGGGGGGGEMQKRQGRYAN